MSKPHKVFRSADVFHDPELPLRIDWGELLEPTFPVHTHTFMELVLILGGRGDHLVGPHRYPLAAGDVFVLSENRQHGFAALHKLQLLNVLMDPHVLFSPPLDLAAMTGYQALFQVEPRYRRAGRFTRYLRLSAPDLVRAHELISRLKSEIEERRPGYRALARALLLEVVVFLCRCYEQDQKVPNDAVLRLAGVLGRLESHYAEPIRLSDLAAQAHLSVNQFLRLFKEATGLSPIAYLLRKRIERAADLLRQTRDPVARISETVGFEDSNYFAKQFRRLMGASPRAYRRPFTEPAPARQNRSAGSAISGGPSLTRPDKPHARGDHSATHPTDR